MIKKVPQEQFTTRGKAAIDQVISKRSLIDHNHLTRSRFTLTSSDLAGCYDRILYTSTALTLLHIGIPHSRICSMFDSIQRMIHRIGTTYMDYKISYGSDNIGK